MSIALWSVAAFAATASLHLHEVTPGKSAQARTKLEGNQIRAGGRLLVFLSPDCECSASTLSNLSDYLGSKPNIETTIYFSCPKPETSRLEGCRLWKQASSIPGAVLRVDADGVTAQHYRAFTSGQCLLYDGPTGKLVYSGGITPGRAEVGPNRGIDALRRFERGSRVFSSFPVYGCALQGFAAG
ncbi:MAG TPA: hypothetical protein VG944_20085 [Fimbriimonas sp.]|nr:hypothetical protein [Fimbriimonas sp.]